MARIIPIEVDESKRWSSVEAAGLPAAPVRYSGSAFARILATIGRRLTRRAAIHELERLDQRLLRDIGVEREEIETFVDTLLEEPKASATMRTAPPAYRPERGRR